MNWDISDLPAIVIGALFVVAIVAMRLKGKRIERKFLVEEDDGELLGTSDDLARAEAQVAQEDRREVLLRDHVLLQRFSTFQGYSTEYLEDLTSFLRKKGISSDYVHQQTLQVGVASATGPVGIFELYVQSDKADEASALIASEFNKA